MSLAVTLVIRTLLICQRFELIRNLCYIRHFLYKEIGIDFRIDFGNVHRFSHKPRGKRPIVARFIHFNDLQYVISDLFFSQYGFKLSNFFPTFVTFVLFLSQSDFKLSNKFPTPCTLFSTSQSRKIVDEADDNTNISVLLNTILKLVSSIDVRLHGVEKSVGNFDEIKTYFIQTGKYQVIFHGSALEIENRIL
jgi:hypothetical protein